MIQVLKCLNVAAAAYIVILIWGVCSPKHGRINRFLLWTLPPVMLLESMTGRVMMAYEFENPLEGLARERLVFDLLLNNAAVGVLLALFLLWICQRHPIFEGTLPEPWYRRILRYIPVICFAGLSVISVCGAAVNLWQAMQMLPLGGYFEL